MNNFSLLSADRVTHLKIVMVGLLLATLVTGIGLAARIQDGAASMEATVVKAGKPVTAATGQDRGKTTTSLGLLASIRERGLRVGFVKPVGQRYLVVDGTRADEDAVLMSEVFGLTDPLNDMSPVTLPRRPG